ncbi:MAG: tRNA 2-thiouridine(34) synthase MnmA [Tepidisphaeraceae bacterium]
MSTARPKVVVAMSGGVDSSVAAALLVRQGYDAVGVFMRLGSPKGVEGSEAAACEPAGKNKQGCCSVLDAADARRVAGVLGIPFYVLNFEDEFGRIIDYFVDEYNRGRTPNPCVRCNEWLKFGKLTQYAAGIGAEFVASGHYARVAVDPVTGERALFRGLDHRKDQSYVLFGMKPGSAEHILLPVGDYLKPDVRRIAEELKLPVFNKPDSQEICFVPNQDYAGLVQRRTPGAFAEGQVVNSQGEVIGTHPGHQHYTIGQRRGLRIAVGHPIYVVDIDAERNRVVMGPRDELLHTRLVARQANWISKRVAMAGGRMNCTAKIRYNHEPAAARLNVSSDREFEVVFEVPQSTIAPGQAVVLYDGDVVLGGGWIERRSL